MFQTVRCVWQTASNQSECMEALLLLRDDSVSASDCIFNMYVLSSHTHACTHAHNCNLCQANKSASQSHALPSVHGALVCGNSDAIFALTQVHSHLVEWSQDLHQLKSIMDTLEEEDRLMDQAYISRNHQSHGSNGTQTNGAVNGGKDLRELTANVAHQTQSALSASTQTPQDGMELLEGIANLSKQMVGEAKEDVELFNRAGKYVGGQDT